MYKKVSTNLNFVEREKETAQFWKDHDIFKKSIETREGDPVYTFYDGPPTANGKPHIGHVLTRVIKDMIPRYRTMKGYMVPRKAGWDTHGLPVELEVEKKLGLDGKEQIEEYGLDPFITQCKESVWKYKGMWEDFSKTVGFWADMDNPYVTYNDNFIESEWWALKTIWDKGLLYKGFKIVPYCPRYGIRSSPRTGTRCRNTRRKSCRYRWMYRDFQRTRRRTLRHSCTGNTCPQLDYELPRRTYCFPYLRENVSRCLHPFGRYLRHLKVWCSTCHSGI